MDCSDFEPVAKLDLLAAILCRLLRGASNLDSAQSQPSSSTLPASSMSTPRPAKSFQEAVASPARSSNCKCEKRLAELLLKEHKQNLHELDQKAEALDREHRQLNLVVYNVPDTADDLGVETFLSLLGKCMPDDPLYEGLVWEQSRLGTFRPDQERPRPIRMHFKSMSDKHTFLKHAKHLKEVSLRYDDDLTTKITTKTKARHGCRL